MWEELSSKWGELTSERGASCLGASFLWGELSWGELSLGQNPFWCFNGSHVYHVNSVKRPLPVPVLI